MSSTSSVKKEEMEEEESIENIYSKLCFDLNMDIETKEDAWNSYMNIKKHYVLEGDQLHWLSVSLYVSCRKNKYLLKCLNNPISISRLLKSSNNLSLLKFFDKLNKWQDMENLPDSIRNKIDQIQNSFHISSIIFEKYSNIFIYLFGGNLQKLFENNFYFQRIQKQINPKLNQKNKYKKCSHEHLYQLIWTIYSFIKTIYPHTSNDLIASFHLLLASFIFVYQLCKKAKLDYLLKGIYFNDNDDLIDKLCEIYSCSSSLTRVICDEYLKNNIFKKLNKDKILLDDENYLETIRIINNEYDEIVLTSCIIDERIFLENKNELNDLLNSLNENRNSKTIENRTPLTADQHLTFLSNEININLTPISQANHLIKILLNLIENQQTKPNRNLIDIIGEQPFLDEFINKINEWEKIFIDQYYLNDNYSINSNEDNYSTSAKNRFQISLKLFYLTLENILLIEKKKFISNNINQQEIKQTLNKIILNNEFLKSLLGLCLLLILYAHSDKIHDLNWIINIYSLQGYSILKIIQIFLKTIKQINQSRSFIKYLSSIEEIIISYMVFSNNSSLWNDIQSRGILTYQYISSIHYKTNSLSPNLFSQSPSSPNVKRKLFTNTTQNELSMIRSRSDPIIDNSIKNNVKLNPYTTFYIKLYDIVIKRIDIICTRLYGDQSYQFKKYVWNLFLYLFENLTEILFRSRDLDHIILSTIYYSSNLNLFQNSNQQQITWFQLFKIYQSIPNLKLKTLRSVFIKKINQIDSNDYFNNKNNNPCLTPSKPAGTIHIIDGNMFGDIKTFYDEIFLNIKDLEKDFQLFIEQNKFIDFPIKTKLNNQHISIHCGDHISIDYSKQNIYKNLFSSSSNIDNNHLLNNQIKTNSSTNILSSSIQAGLNNTVQTTRIRTDDGKFLTTISTLSKFNYSNDQNYNNNNNQQNTILFGQPIKRTSSDNTYSNSNSLNSLTKKVLQIENDRLNIQQ